MCQASSFILEGAYRLPSWKGHFYDENVNLKPFKGHHIKSTGHQDSCRVCWGLIQRLFSRTNLCAELCPYIATQMRNDEGWPMCERGVLVPGSDLLVWQFAHFYFFKSIYLLICCPSHMIHCRVSALTYIKLLPSKFTYQGAWWLQSQRVTY